MTIDEIAKLLKICDQTHGAEDNQASVYGHYESRRICMRLFGTDIWVYDPKWEMPSSAPSQSTWSCSNP